MMPRRTLLPSKLAPPRLNRRILRRPGLEARLAEALDYRVTVVQAGTGYGKTTALTALARLGVPLCWYSVGEGDADPQTFLAYLIAACAGGLPGLPDTAAVAHAEAGAAGGGWAEVLDALLAALDAAVAGPALLVLDDYHFAAGSPEIRALTERLIAYAPPDLHIVLAMRYPLPGGELVRWRARGEALEISRSALAFSAAETAALFCEVYGLGLSEAEVAALTHRTEGWPIALQLVWQGLHGAAGRGVADLLASGSGSLAAIFDYLASDVLGRQPPELAAFLRDTAVLRELDPALCDALRGATDSAALLRALRERDLFVVELSEGHYRYHHVFHEFLRQQAAAEGRLREAHRGAAARLAARGDDEEAIYHWMAAGAAPEAAAAVERAGEGALREGRLDTLAGWVDALPPDSLAERPRLLAYLGDLYRLRSRFDEALSWYAQAERAARERGDRAETSRALRGQALVYLDQVQPAQAESLLQEALRLSDGGDDNAARARLLELLAENKLNMGKPGEAVALRAEARALRDEAPADDLLSVRVLLRTGRLDQARAILEQWVDAEGRAAASGRLAAPRGHRETTLILSLIHSFRGEVACAAELAAAGRALGERLGSPFITAVAHMRFGHARQIAPADEPPGAGGRRDEAIASYRRCIALGDRIASRRLRAEAMWGLARAYGFSGDLEAAADAAREGVAVAQWAGDQWVAAMTELTLGASMVLAGRPDEAAELLGRVLVSFRSCGDSLGRAVTRLWLALAHADLRQPTHAAAHLDDALAICAAGGYDFLFTAPTFLGPPDPRRAAPLLIAARARPAHAAYAGRLLAALGLAEAQAHPGYRLRVRTLGGFRVWRGVTEVEARDWQRDKARQLFQLLVARRGRWMQRDELCDLLWPRLAPEVALRDFKVALNALNKALEPARAADAPYAFIARDGAAYRLRPEADLWLDDAAFAEGCARGLALLDAGDEEAGAAALEEALALYAGPYLPEALYDDWAADERERLQAIFLRAAERLAAARLAAARLADAADLCRRILAHDRCYEPAYQLLMRAHAREGNRPLALRAFQRCAEALHDDLGVEPAAETVALAEQIRRGDASSCV
jgi:LuxR family maltose regulon positive regulatory protein